MRIPENYGTSWPQQGKAAKWVTATRAGDWQGQTEERTGHGQPALILKGDSRMHLSRRLTGRRHRAVATAVACGALLLAAGSLAGSSGASSGVAAQTKAAVTGYPATDPSAPWVWQKFLAQNQDDVEMLSSLGIDVTEGTDKNPDGSAWISILVTPAQRAYLQALGFQAGQITETEADAQQAQQRR